MCECVAWPGLFRGPPLSHDHACFRLSLSLSILLLFLLLPLVPGHAVADRHLGRVSSTHLSPFLVPSVPHPLVFFLLLFICFSFFSASSIVRWRRCCGEVVGCCAVHCLLSLLVNNSFCPSTSSRRSVNRLPRRPRASSRTKPEHPGRVKLFRFFSSQIFPFQRRISLLSTSPSPTNGRAVTTNLSLPSRIQHQPHISQ